MGEELFPASEEERGAWLLKFFLFVRERERERETEDERKSGTRLFQKVGSLRPHLVWERDTRRGREREREREEACRYPRLRKGVQSSTEKLSICRGHGQ